MKARERTILPEQKNPMLREVAREVPQAHIKSPHIRRLVADMKSLLAKEEYGVALAAPQVGEPLRIFVVSSRALARDGRLPAQAGNAPDELKEEEDGKPLSPAKGASLSGKDQVYINPVLLKLSRSKKKKHEGCLSIRGMWGEVLRAEKATLRAYDERGCVFTRGAAGFLAHVFQHEMDHLEGILYTDKATAVYDEPTKA